MESIILNSDAEPGEDDFDYGYIQHSVFTDDKSKQVEDIIVRKQIVTVNGTVKLFALINGFRNGRVVAEFVEKELVNRILLNENLLVQHPVEDPVVQFDLVVKKIISDAFVNIDSEYFNDKIDGILAARMQTKLVADEEMTVESVEELSEADNQIAGGAVVVLALLVNKRLFVANCGNSVAILVKQGTEPTDLNAFQVSELHESHEVKEMERLHQIGLDPMLVVGPSRCFGDYFRKGGYTEYPQLKHAYKEPVSVDPAIAGGTEVDDTYCFLLLLSPAVVQAVLKIETERKAVLESVMNDLKIKLELNHCQAPESALSMVLFPLSSHIRDLIKPIDGVDRTEMVSLIKNQLIKHLSVFAKNLKPDQISLEVLSGSGELRNIVLNEDILTEKLELPSFLKIRRAECNRVKVNIPWTKINSSPVKIIVDELHVALELGPSKGTDPPKKAPPPTGYGFAERVVENLSIKINVLDISFESEGFSGSLWLSPLVVESKSPLFQDITNLKKARLSDASCHQVIFFKQVSWNLMKIQAFAHSEGNSDRGKRLNAPLRLITQGGKCRIAIKKDSNDGSLLAGRIQMIFDDIHWVATLAEIRSAIAFQKHIVALAKASSTHSPENPFLVDYSAKSRSQQRLPNPAIKSTTFKQFDVGQTSHHVYVSKVHLTLIDDSSNESDYPDNWNIKSGAIQVTLDKISIDFYLQNLIADERRYWVRYSTPNEFTAFCGSELQRHLTTLSIGMDPSARERLTRLWSTLTSQTLVIRMDDVTVECVSEQSTKRDDLQDVYTSKTSAKFSMPHNVPAFHVEFSNFFFPGSKTEPPPNLAQIAVGPTNILVDNRTIRWLLYVVDNITRTLDIDESSVDPPVACVRADLLMPKLIIPAYFADGDPHYPEKFVVNVSTVTISNRALENETFSVENLFQQLKDDNINFISSLKHTNQHELRNHVLNSKQLAAELATNGSNMDLLSTKWYLSTSPLWMEAILPSAEKNKKLLSGITVISDVMLAGCIDAKLPNIYLALEPLNALSVIVDHFQFLQLMRVQKSIGDLLEQIEIDKKFFSKQHGFPVSDSPLSLYCFCDEINVHLILPLGVAPSPYDLHNFVKSDTMTTLSSVKYF
ncbi:hypothetical protein FO519_002989 [Halicephalobus sp. NKZ332]|nr:hypothetical protein FO519_002989 [Halicephalobus sp. NKZ332]